MTAQCTVPPPRIDATIPGRPTILSAQEFSDPHHLIPPSIKESTRRIADPGGTLRA